MPIPSEILSGRQVFHVGPARLLVVPALFLGLGVLLLMVAPFDSNPNAVGAGLAVFGALAAIGLLFFGLVYYTTLTLDAEGIVLRQAGYRICSSWANVERIQLPPAEPVIILKESGTRGLGAKLLRGAVAITPPSKLVGGPARELAEGRAITLAPFMAHYRRGPLRVALERYAPHLLAPAP